MLLSSKEYTPNNFEELFEWYERRVVVTEKNTQMLTLIISFLLPIMVNNFGCIPHNLSTVIMLNITSAVISMGIIWVPKENVQIMRAVKDIKTMFHLFTLSLLLLALFIMINHYFIR